MLSAAQLDAFWLPPSDILTRPELTRADLAEFELATGWRFPEILAALLARQNGGWLRWSLFRAPDGRTTPVEFLRGLDRTWRTPSLPARAGETLLCSSDDGALLLSWNDGHELRPRVLLARDDDHRELLAESVDALVAGLVGPEPEWRVGLRWDDDLEDLAAELDDALDTRFTLHESGQWTAALRGRSSTGDDGEAQAWLRANGRTHAAHDVPWSDAPFLLELDTEPNTAAWALQQLADFEPVVLHDPTEPAPRFPA